MAYRTTPLTAMIGRLLRQQQPSSPHLCQGTATSIFKKYSPPALAQYNAFQGRFLSTETSSSESSTSSSPLNAYLHFKNDDPFLTLTLPNGITTHFKVCK
jgi:hypothetical protein